MQWSEVTKKPSLTQLRQFSGLWLIFFGGIAAWRLWNGDSGPVTTTLGILAVTLGPLGLIVPGVMRWIYSAWMIAVFPIGWTVSRVILGIMYFLVFTPVALYFKITGRDALHLKNPKTSSYWVTRGDIPDSAEYLRQS